MATTFKKNGYGQVEPNHLSAQRTGQIYAQLPLDDSIEVLENGTFLVYDMMAGKATYLEKAHNATQMDGATALEPMLVFNEVKLYEDKYFAKDFALKKSESVDGVITPRLFKTNIGDIFTTNNITDGDYEVGDMLSIAASEGKLVKLSGDDTSEYYIDSYFKLGFPMLLIVEITTMPDSEPAVKLQRIK